MFGKVLLGMDTLERVYDTPCDDDYLPYETEIRIVDSGEIPTEPFVVDKQPVQVCSKYVMGKYKTLMSVFIKQSRHQLFLHGNTPTSLPLPLAH